MESVHKTNDVQIIFGMCFCRVAMSRDSGQSDYNAHSAKQKSVCATVAHVVHRTLSYYE